jgi:hypothetical protein
MNTTNVLPPAVSLSSPSELHRKTAAFRFSSKLFCALCLVYPAFMPQASAADLVADTPRTYEDGTTLSCDSIKINIHQLGFWSAPLIELKEGTSLIANEGVQARVSSSSNGSDEGNTTLFRIEGSSLTIKGDIDIQSELQGEVNIGGANVFWATGQSTIELGSEGSTTKIWDIASKPDALSAKDRSTITVHSTNNQIAGSIDFVHDGDNYIGNIKEGVRNILALHNYDARSFAIGYIIFGSDRAKQTANEIFGLMRPAFNQVLGKDSRVSMTIDGEGNYWFGDEQNGGNLYVDVTAESEMPFFGEHDQKPSGQGN